MTASRLGFRRGTKVERILRTLLDRPLTARELADEVDDIPAYIARTMAKLRERGLILNASGSAGRGSTALYDLTPYGRAGVAEGRS